MNIFVDMDDVICDYTSAHAQNLLLHPGIQFPQSQYGFFSRLKPIDGAIKAVNDIHASEKFDLYILTAPSVRNPFSYSEKRIWVEEHLGYELVDRLIICSHKHLLLGDILIDDNISGKGQERFQGRLIHFGGSDFPDWESVRAELKLV